MQRFQGNCGASDLMELGYDYTRNEAWQDLTEARLLAMEAHELAKSICSRPRFNPLHRKHVATSASVLRVIERREGRYDASLNWAKITVREQALFIRDFPDLDSIAIFIRYLLTESSDSVETGEFENARRRLEQAEDQFQAIVGDLRGHSAFELLQTDIRLLSEQVNCVEASLRFQAK